MTKHPGEEETVVWMRSGTQGNKWRFADLTFNSDKPIQVVLLLLLIMTKKIYLGLFPLMFSTVTKAVFKMYNPSLVLFVST